MTNQQKGQGTPEPFGDELLGEDLDQLSEDLRHLYQQETRAHAHSLERVYARLQAIEDTGSLPTETLKTTIQTGNANMAPPSRRSAPVAPSRLTRIAAILATGFLVTGALWGYLYFHAQRPVSPGPILTATLQCHSTPSFAVPDTNLSIWQLQPLDWSARGEIMWPMGDTFFDSSTCASVPVAFKPPAPRDYPGLDGGGSFAGLWSPDGKRLLLLLSFDEPPYYEPPAVLDATTGKLVANLQMSSDSMISRLTPQTGQAVWSADGTQVITLTAFGSVTTSGVLKEGVSSYKVQVWDSRTGALLHTGLGLSLDNLPFDQAWLSPGGAYVAVRLPDCSIQFWDTTTEQLVSTTPPLATGFGGTVAWSPDGSYFAFGISSANPSATPGQVQIWSRATGHRVATLTDTNTSQGYIMGLAWSPNGRYLAETSGQINIWDTSTWQQVATFGQVPAGTANSVYYISSVTWSPDSSMLASTKEWTVVNPPDPNLNNLRTVSGYSQLDVWQLLSSGGTTTPVTPTIPPPTTATSPAASPTSSATPVASPTSPPAAPGRPAASPTAPTKAGTPGSSASSSG